MGGRAVPTCGPSGRLTSAGRGESIGFAQCPQSGEPWNGGSTLSLLAAFSRSPPRWRHARRSRRRTILPACSRTRPSSLLALQRQPLRLNRRTLPILSNLWTQSTRWTIIAMGSPTHFSQSGGGQAGARPLRSPSSRRAAVAFGRSGRDEGPVVTLRHEAAETALGPRWPFDAVRASAMLQGFSICLSEARQRLHAPADADEGPTGRRFRMRRSMARLQKRFLAANAGSPQTPSLLSSQLRRLLSNSDPRRLQSTNPMELLSRKGS
jgi:hypothetical protein